MFISMNSTGLNNYNWCDYKIKSIYSPNVWSYSLLCFSQTALTSSASTAGFTSLRLLSPYFDTSLFWFLSNDSRARRVLKGVPSVKAKGLIKRDRNKRYSPTPRFGKTFFLPNLHSLLSTASYFLHFPVYSLSLHRFRVQNLDMNHKSFIAPQTLSLRHFRRDVLRIALSKFLTNTKLRVVTPLGGPLSFEPNLTPNPDRLARFNLPFVKQFSFLSLSSYRPFNLDSSNPISLLVMSNCQSSHNLDFKSRKARPAHLFEEDQFANSSFSELLHYPLANYTFNNILYGTPWFIKVRPYTLRNHLHHYSLITPILTAAPLCPTLNKSLIPKSRQKVMNLFLSRFTSPTRVYFSDTYRQNVRLRRRRRRLFQPNRFLARLDTQPWVNPNFSQQPPFFPTSGTYNHMWSVGGSISPSFSRVKGRRRRKTLKSRSQPKRVLFRGIRVLAWRNISRFYKLMFSGLVPSPDTRLIIWVYKLSFNYFIGGRLRFSKLRRSRRLSHPSMFNSLNFMFRIFKSYLKSFKRTYESTFNSISTFADLSSVSWAFTATDVYFTDWALKIPFNLNLAVPNILALTAPKTFSTFSVRGYRTSLLDNEVIEDTLDLDSVSFQSSRSYRLPLSSNYSLPLTLTSTGFLFLYSEDVTFFVHSTLTHKLARAKFFAYRFSFFSTTEIKRILIRRPTFLKLLNSFKNSSSLTEMDLLLNESTSSTSHHFSTSPSFLALKQFEPGLEGFRVRSVHSLYTTPLSATPRQEPTLKRVRFKPGYQRVWRQARASLNYTLGFHFRYQKGLTKRISRLRRISTLDDLKLQDLTLTSLLINARIVLEESTSQDLISTSSVFVNGYASRQSNMKLFVGDFIQLIVGLRYYILHKWLLNWSHYSSVRLVKFLSSRNNLSRVDLSKQVSRSYPNWILKSGYRISDIPKYLEVDYFSLSVYFIYEPNYLTDFNPLSYLKTRSNIYSVYNWKFIN